MRIYKNYKESNQVTLHNGDCIDLLRRLPDESVDLVITSPPYCIGKAYEDPHNDIKTFRTQHTNIFDELYRVVKPGGSVCWQVGYAFSNGFYHTYFNMEKNREALCPQSKSIERSFVRPL